MRILIWSETFWPATGGVELFLERLIADLIAHGHQIEVLTSYRRADRPDDDEVGGVRVRRVPLFETLQERRPDAILRLKRTVAAMVAEFRPDVTHINMLGPGPALLLDTPAARPSVVTLHATFESLHSAGPDTLFGRVLRRATWITACSHVSLEWVLRLLPEVRAKSSAIHLGVDIPPTAPSPPSFAPPRLLGVGRLVPMKGFDIAIEAMAKVRSVRPDVHLTIAGDGPERPGLEAQARALGLSDAIAFLGWQSQADVYALQAASSLCIMPSRNTRTEYTEGLGLVALEAAAVGRAVVGTRVGGVPEAIADGETGLLVPPDDAAALAEAILTLLADPERTTAMGTSARDRARQLFDWRACSDAFHALFLRLFRGPSTPTHDDI